MGVSDVDVTDAESVLAFLVDGGPHCEVMVFSRSAYVWNVDDTGDPGSQRRVPVAVVRDLIQRNQIAVWHGVTYRPTVWVEAWNRGERPWWGDYMASVWAGETLVTRTTLAD